MKRVKNKKRATLIITTSRRPSPRTRSLVKDLVDVIPGAVRLTRGHMSMEELAIEAKIRGAHRILVIASRQGNPSLLRFYGISGGSVENTSSLLIKGVTLARETGRGERGVAGKAKGVMIYVETPTSMAETVGEALLVGLGAKVAGDREVEDYVVAAVGDTGKGYALVRFYFRKNEVGPRLKLVPTRRTLGEG